jgi:hypothetical protein
MTPHDLQRHRQQQERNDRALFFLALAVLAICGAIRLLTK